jgi:hypothetical protein
MNSSGISALIHIGAQLENDFGMETLSIGSPAVGDADCILQIAAPWLAYEISLHGGAILLSAIPMDSAEPPDLLLRDKDTETGWATTRGVINALEKYQIKSLERPIEAAGDDRDDANGWVIA